MANTAAAQTNTVSVTLKALPAATVPLNTKIKPQAAFNNPLGFAVTGGRTFQCTDPDGIVLGPADVSFTYLPNLPGNPWLTNYPLLANKIGNYTCKFNFDSNGPLATDGNIHADATVVFTVQ